MKKIILAAILCFAVLKGYPQCPDCHAGKRDLNGNDKNVVHVLPPDSSGGLALSYKMENVCGLNWQQSSVLTTTRYTPTPGTGLPCTVPLTFDSCNVDSLLVAFLYFNGSYQTPYAANPASVTITNPAAQVFNYLADSIGTGPSKCWGETGTIAYRVNITSCIKGGGNYIVNPSGTGISAWSIDGTTILVVYVDKSATYTGSIVLYDGLWTGQGIVSQTFSGFNVCKATPTGQAFSILADMQSNVNGGINTQNYNGSSNTFPNLFYNFCTVTTSLTAAQTSTTYSCYTNNAGDCYSWVLAGLYWQNSNCKTCVPSVTGTLSVTVTPPADTICQGDSVQLNAHGANSYIWAPATGLSCNNCPNPKASPNATTTYTLTGFNGCNFGKDTVQVVVASKATPTVTPANPQICSSGSVQLNVTGGGNYVWKPSATLSCYNCSNPIASPTVTTTYTVVEGVNGCKDSATVTVSVVPSPTVSVIPASPTICAGGKVTLKASGATNYTWTPAASLSCPNCNSPFASPTVTTIYTIVGTNGTCSDTTTDTVFVLTVPVAAISPKPDSVCQGDTAVLIGSGGKTYKWSTGETTDSIKVAPAANTTYTLTAYNGICSDAITVTIKVTPKVSAITNIADSVICPHDTSYLTVTASGGPATYKWSNGATTSSIIVSDTVTTTYTATVYGICDSVQNTMKVTVVPLPVPVIKGTGTSWKCRGTRDTLKVSSVTNPTTYVWSNGSTTTSYITGNLYADSTVYVTAYNSLGCPATDTFHITERAYPAANIIYPSGCGNIPITVTATPIGIGPFTYKWNTGGTYDTINVLIVNDTTNYTVVISNGCPITKTVSVIEDVPALSACCNTTILLGGDTTINASGGDIVKYSWAPDSGLNCDTCANVIATPTITTTYTVTGTDAKGCMSERIVTIVVEIPCFSFTVPNVFTPTYSGALGVDNVFYIKAENVDAWSITIYDRWGKEMFKTTNPDNYWNGSTESGGQAPSGVYYYVINATCQGNTYKKDGFIQLIR